MHRHLAGRSLSELPNEPRPIRTAWRRTIALALAATVVLASCVSAAGPTGSGGSPGSGTPGATSASTLAPGATPTPTLAPGATPTLPGSSPTLKPTKKPKPSPTSTPPPTAGPTPEHANWPPGAIGTKAAANHIGEKATVCGAVVSANWVLAEKGHPTWLNLDDPYPHPTFNVTIWGEQRRQWPLSGKPEVVYLGKTICTTGTIEQYRDWLQIAGVGISDIQVVPGS